MGRVREREEMAVGRQASAPRRTGSLVSTSGSPLRRAIVTGWLLAAALFFACGDSGGRSGGSGGGATDVDIESFLVARSSADQEDCGCRAARGTVADLDLCKGEIATSPESTADCLEVLAEQHQVVEANCCSVNFDFFMANSPHFELKSARF